MYFRDWNETERAAVSLTGTVDDFVARAKTIMACDYSRPLLLNELNAIRFRLWCEFGNTRGWLPTRSWFSTQVLANGKVHAGRGRHYGREWPFTDHRYAFRWPDRRAAAVAGNPYDLGPDDTDGRARAAEWAAINGLKVSFPDFPSWWNPGHTNLVLFERATETLVG